MPRLAKYRGFLGKLLQQLGTEVGRKQSNGEDGPETLLRTTEITSGFAPYDLVRQMRASFNVLGPLLARTGQAKVSLPGGCTIGARPVDLHLKAMEALGARIDLHEGYVYAQGAETLRGLTAVRSDRFSDGFGRRSHGTRNAGSRSRGRRDDNHQCGV